MSVPRIVWGIFSVLLFFVFYFLFPQKTFAAFSLSISSINPDTVSSSGQEVTVNISINDLPSESYFRVAWQKSSGETYFGYMLNNNNDWVKVESSQDCKNYYKISDLTTTSLTIKTKIGEENTVNNRSYLLKARRYTTSCSSYYTDSDPVSIQVNFSTLTATPTQVPFPTQIKTPTPIPTNKSTPTSKATQTPTFTFTLTPTTKVVVPTIEGIDIGPTSILGEMVTAAPSAMPTEAIQKEEGPFFDFPKIAIGLGFVFLSTSGILAFRSYKKSQGDDYR
ncbi:MAG: hypothetical protein HYV37_01640 [Candidatus Levyibacteriota bacterium]|nr:MAG: hypothetical protein HYV37_01640 [Candidatus Levybacteria bacterium]